jgi:hypothetical protein
MALFQGILWYALSFQQGKLLALGGNSGNHIYDVCPWYIAPFDTKLTPTRNSFTLDAS